MDYQPIGRDVVVSQANRLRYAKPGTGQFAGHLADYFDRLETGATPMLTEVILSYAQLRMNAFRSYDVYTRTHTGTLEMLRS